MIELMAAIVGLGATAWAMLTVGGREIVRSRLAQDRGFLWTCLCIAVVFVLIHMFLSWRTSLQLSSAEWTRSVLDTSASLCLVVVLAAAVWSVFRPRRWTDAAVDALSARFDDLLHPNSVSTAVRTLERLLRDSTAWKLSATDRLIDRCFRFPGFAEELVAVRPRLAALLLTRDREYAMAHSDEILAAAFRPRLGSLRQELSRCEVSDCAGGVVIEADCHILTALFKDARFAEELAAWRPIGNAVLAELAMRRHSGTIDIDNLPWLDRDEERLSRETMPCAIHFFYVMVTCAMRQGITYHMGLYYLRHFVDAMLENSKPDPAHSPTEFPNGYLYWVYQCLDHLGEIAAGASRLPPDSPHRVVPATGFDTIPTCALDAYGCSLVHVVRHKDCPRRFKGDRVASMLHLHRRLRDDNSVPGLDAVLVRGIRHWATDSDVEEILQHLAPEQFGGLSEEVALLTAALRPTRAGG